MAKKNLAEDPYEALANAIIVQACEDYRAALRKLKKNPKNQDAMAQTMECERFFRSGWYQLLTAVDGEYLIERLRAEITERQSE